MADAYAGPLIDAHVHIYDCFDLPRFLDSAYRNFRVQAEKMRKDSAIVGILLLSESSGFDWFGRLSRKASLPGPVEPVSTGRWRVDLTSEDCSLIVRRDSNKQMLLIAGRQITTQEDLEVLALCTASRFSDDLSLSTTVENVRRAGGIPVIPWGTGKWLGRRRAVLSRFLESQDPDTIFLGDNSARPVFWRRPSHFEQARASGIRILPGTDPLPFPSECWRPGSFGFAVGGTIAPVRPAEDIRRILLDPSSRPEPYGSLETPYRFFRNQVAMQLRKRMWK